MSRLIDADAFDERVRVAGGMSEEELTEDFKDGVQAVLYMLRSQPAIQHKNGNWIKIHPAGIYECSKCGHHIMTNDIDTYLFCHNCGAKMDET